jgi:hypothetical protein
MDTTVQFMRRRQQCPLPNNYPRLEPGNNEEYRFRHSEHSTITSQKEYFSGFRYCTIIIEKVQNCIEKGN